MAIILNKGETTAVTKKDSDAPVVNLTVGAAWGKIAKLGESKAAGFLGKLLGKVGAADVVYEEVDLDLSLVFFDKDKNVVDTCYFGNKVLFGGGVTHTGDDLVGSDESDGSDNERIKIVGTG
ncbi:UNVERIFIED_CONTAM: TerD family protein, partial [Kocuria sp. CPCC 205274]